jgi:hypothetical protein
MTPKHLKYMDAIVALAIATAFLLIAQHAESAEVDYVFDYATGTQYLCVWVSGDVYCVKTEAVRV